MTARVKFVTPASLRWCQDTNRVLVIDEATGLAVSLSGLDAALWKWYGLGYKDADVLEFTRAFLNLPREETRARLNQILTNWVEAGLLVEEHAP